MRLKCYQDPCVLVQCRTPCLPPFCAPQAPGGHQEPWNQGTGSSCCSTKLPRCFWKVQMTTAALRPPSSQMETDIMDIRDMLEQRSALELSPHLLALFSPCAWAVVGASPCWSPMPRRSTPSLVPDLHPVWATQPEWPEGPPPSR